MEFNKVNRFFTYDRIILFILLLFLGIYLDVSLLNHYYMRSGTLDYGYFNQTLYSISNGLEPLFTLDPRQDKILNFFGDHFSPILYFLL